MTVENDSMADTDYPDPPYPKLTKRQIIKTLKDSVGSRQTSRLYRDGIDGESAWWDGYVIDVSENWVLLNWVSDEIKLIGHMIFRIQDISVVETEYARQGLIREALRMDSSRPSGVQGLRLDSIQSILEWAKQHCPVVGLYREHIRRNSTIVGQVQSLREQTFGIRRITPEITWGKEAEYRYDELTRIELDGGYIRAVRRVATTRGLIPHV